MRMLLPPKKTRQKVCDLLSTFYDFKQDVDFARAIELLCNFYQIKEPGIVWYESLGENVGQTTYDGRLELVHPEHTHETKRQWIRTLYHELWHLLHWVEDEAKAEVFARKFVTGLKE